MVYTAKRVFNGDLHALVGMFLKQLCIMSFMCHPPVRWCRKIADMCLKQEEGWRGGEVHGYGTESETIYH